jgi:hypothetical protein
MSIASAAAAARHTNLSEPKPFNRRVIVALGLRLLSNGQKPLTASNAIVQRHAAQVKPPFARRRFNG